MKLNKEEKEIVKSYEKGEWRSVKNLKATIAQHQKYAKATLRKDKRVNIRMPSSDLEKIQTIAIEEGLPYQTFIASILHKYASGKLRESRQHAHA